MTVPESIETSLVVKREPALNTVAGLVDSDIALVVKAVSGPEAGLATEKVVGLQIPKYL